MNERLREVRERLEELKRAVQQLILFDTGASKVTGRMAQLDVSLQALEDTLERDR
jgi:hypothetical protein